MKVTFPRTKYRSKKVDDYLRRGMATKEQTQQKDTGGRWKDPTWLVLFGNFTSCPAPYQNRQATHPW
jgi:hypothetical protein